VADELVTVGDVIAAPDDEVVEVQLPNTVESVEPVAEVPVADTVPFMDVVPFTPPPSKLEKVEVNAAIPEADDVALGQPTPPPELNDGSEPGVVGEIDIVVLKPPGLSSTEPKGIPVGATVVRGDVVPIADGVAVLT
jgi:hypothetical protein